MYFRGEVRKNVFELHRKYKIRGQFLMIRNQIVLLYQQIFVGIRINFFWEFLKDLQWQLMWLSKIMYLMEGGGIKKKQKEAGSELCQAQLR